MPDWAYLHFSTLVSRRISDSCKTDSPLFVNYHRKGYPRLSESTLYRIYKRVWGTGCHSARATFATQLKDQGFNDEDVAVALRHSTTQQVQVYDKRRVEIGRNVSVKVKY